MKSLKTAMLFLTTLSIVLCSQAVAAQKSKGANAIPYPLKGNGKGSRGKTLAELKTRFYRTAQSA